MRSETDFQVVSLARENMARDALRLAADYDFTIIDRPPQAETISRSCIVASDLVLVPIEPGGASRWSSDLTVRQLKEAQELKPTLKCGFVISRKNASTILGRDTRMMAADAGIPVFDTEIEQRIAYAEAMTMGKTIFEWSGPDSACTSVFRAQANLNREVENLTSDGRILNGGQNTHPTGAARAFQNIQSSLSEYILYSHMCRQICGVQ